MTFSVYSIIALAIGYLFGSIPFALVIGKVFYHTDVREYGSGNLGGTNTGRVLGKKAGLSVIILDAVKAIIAMLVMYFISKDNIMYAGWGAAVGHCYPLFANFKGGKAVATIAGYYVGLCIFGLGNWFVFLAGFATFMLILKIFKYVSLSSICLFVVITIGSFIYCQLHVAISMLILLCFTTIRHRANIKRIIDGSESKIKWM